MLQALLWQLQQVSSSSVTPLAALPGSGCAGQVVGYPVHVLLNVQPSPPSLHALTPLWWLCLLWVLQVFGVSVDPQWDMGCVV